MLLIREREEGLPPEFAGIPVDDPARRPPDEVQDLQAQFPSVTAAAPSFWQRRRAPSGLRGRDIVVARNMAVQAAFLTLHHRNQLHYTQGAQRWEGIARHLRAWRGEYPHHGDCSSTEAWWLWQALLHFHIGDVVNGEHFRAGYTGTMLNHGEHVRGALMRADAVIYGRRWPGEHTAMYVGGGKVISHGSEGGPYFEPMRYRPDVLAIRRYL